MKIDIAEFMGNFRAIQVFCGLDSFSDYVNMNRPQYISVCKASLTP
jgi:hypothetical protein